MIIPIPLLRGCSVVANLTVLTCNAIIACVLLLSSFIVAPTRQCASWGWSPVALTPTPERLSTRRSFAAHHHCPDTRGRFFIGWSPAAAAAAAAAAAGAAGTALSAAAETAGPSSSRDSRISMPRISVPCSALSAAAAPASCA
jgi:hypothetical protein